MGAPHGASLSAALGCRAQAGAAFGVIRRLGIGSWNVELFRRMTFLVDAGGRVVASWGRVKIRGHALEVLEVARALVTG